MRQMQVPVDALTKDELHQDVRMSLRLTTMWTNFVKFGNPTPDPREVGVSWEPVNKDENIFHIQLA